MNLMNISRVTTPLTMSTLEIAELTNKEHKHVLTDTRNMFEGLEIDSAGFTAQYKDRTGRTLPMFNLDKELTFTLIAGYNVKLRNAIVKRWQELEAAKQPQLPTDYISALEHLLEAKKNEQKLLTTITEQKPKVEFVDNFVDSSGLKTFRQVAKVLGINERKFREFLKSEKIMYQQGSSWLPYAEHLKAKRFENKTGESGGHTFISSYFTPKGEVWIAGLLKDKNLIK